MGKERHTGVACASLGEDASSIASWQPLMIGRKDRLQGLTTIESL